MPADPPNTAAPNNAPQPPRPVTPHSAIVDTRTLVEDYYRPELLPIDELADERSPRVLILARGMTAQSVKPLVDEWRDRPERRFGTATLTDLASLIEWTNRNKDPSSVIFIDRSQTKPSVTAIIDYHEPGDPAIALPRFCNHRGVYHFPLSEPWRAWAAIDGKAMSHGDFADWLEDRIGDVIAPPDHLADAESLSPADLKLIDVLKMLGGQFVGPSRLLDLSRGLKMTEEARFTSIQNTTSGEMTLAYEREHREHAGAPLKVPSLFLLGIPVFDRGPVYRIPARLRYRLAGAKLTWIVTRYRPQLSFDDAVDDQANEVRDGTGLPIFSGQPEFATASAPR
jgi:uncharacterized protein YfdQ (DUF2303 family)